MARLDQALALRMVALCMVALCTNGCSLVKLSGDIEQAQCASDSDCEVLNQRSAPDFDPCEVWQCASTLYCERSVLDSDRDGFSPRTAEQAGDEIVCVAEESQVDCDDDEPESEPSRDEVCDRLDNDCDEHVDEGALERDPTVLSVFADENAGGPGEVSYAIDPDSGTVAVAYGIARASGSVPGLSTIDGALSSSMPIAALQTPEGAAAILSDSIGVGALGGDRFAVAFINTSGARRMVAGTVDSQGDGFALVASEAMLARGVRCAADEACNTAESAPVIAMPATSAPALAVQEARVVMAYARTPEDAVACAEKADDAPVAAVLASALTHDARSGLLAAGSDEPTLSVGQTADPSTPALLAVPVFETGDGVPGFVVAFANGDGDIVLRQLRATEFDTFRFEAGEAKRVLTSDADRFSDVAIALGPMDGNARMLGIAAQRGCGTESRIVFSRVRVTASPAGTLAFTLESGPVEIGGRSSETRASLSFSEARDAWLIAYRDPTGLRGRVLTSDGALLGAESYTLLANQDSDAGELHVASTPLALPLPTSTDLGWFGAITSTQREGDHALQSVTLSSCE